MVFAVLLIGLTGGIGSGKTYVANTFKQLNVPVIFADNIAKELLYNDQNVKLQVQNYFKIADLHKNIKQIKFNIFKNKKHRVFLEKLIHPLVIQTIKMQIQNLAINHHSNIYCVIEIPMVFNLLNIISTINIHKIIMVSCDQNLQISRVMHRDKLSKSQVLSIIKSQLSPTRLSGDIDYLLDSTRLDGLNLQIKDLHQKFLHYYHYKTY